MVSRPEIQSKMVDGCSSPDSAMALVSSDEDESPFESLADGQSIVVPCPKSIVLARNDDDTLVPHHGEILPTTATSVMFDPVISIYPIPPRSSYTHPHEVWSSFAEIEAMKTRNWLEFAADGFDWRNVAEEDDMVMSQTTNENHGTPIHPIHTNPLLGSALLRRIPYPQAQHVEAIGCYADEDGGAVCWQQQDWSVLLDRPAAPFVGMEDSADEDEEDDNEETDLTRGTSGSAQVLSFA